MKVKTAKCRHGNFLYFADDTFVGRSLELYGEYSESEVFSYQTCVKEGDTCIVVGANIGALVVPLARMVGQHGHVFAYEPQPASCMLLRQNLEINNVTNVTVKQCAVGAVKGTTKIAKLEDVVSCNFGGIAVGNGSLTVPVETLDDLAIKYDKIVNFIHVDAEGSELDVLRGATRLIKRHRPMMYVENDREQKALALIGHLVDNDYRCWWHRPYLFNEDNFNQCKRNVFGNIVSINMLCCPGEKRIEVRGLDEVADLRISPDMYDREYARFMREVERQPDDLTARLLCAHYAGLMQRTDEARRLLAENLARDPDHFSTLAIRGLLDLQAGKYDTGWPGYELRYLMRDKTHFGGTRQFGLPHWDGQPTDEPVLIWAEQGFGDNIMFARFMKNVLEIAPNAILETQPQLFELFELSNLVPSGRLYRRGRTLPKFSYHCSLPSLPATLKLYNESQLRSPPYLKAEPEMISTWHKKLPGSSVGVCYKGSPRSERPYSRDIPAELLDPITRRFDHVIDLTQNGQFESFADSAAAVMALDLVISVDTSVAHLAGALGKPTWLLLSTDPDWRHKLRGDRSVWYDSMRIFRQHKFMNWNHVIAEVNDALLSSKVVAAHGH